MENVVEITKDQILTEVQNMWYGGYRLITASCVSLGENGFDILYHFDKDLNMKHYKVTVQKNEEVPSISNIYFCAILVENEMKELFGINIKGIAVDFEGHMLLSDEELDAPMAKQQVIIEQKKGAK